MTKQSQRRCLATMTTVANVRRRPAPVPNSGIGDGRFWIEFGEPCDDSIAGALYEVTVDGSVTGARQRRVLCKRGVTTDGLCV